jgi:hypothetical protein
MYAMGPPACHPDDVGHFIGYSVRSSGWRYTRWVNVTIDGVPFWHEVIIVHAASAPYNCTSILFTLIANALQQAIITSQHTRPHAHTSSIGSSLTHNVCAALPISHQVIGEEMYAENVTSDDYDRSETRNIVYTDAADPSALQLLRTALAAHHGQG